MDNSIDKNALTGAIAEGLSTVAAAIGFTGGFTYVAGYLAVSFYLSHGRAVPDRQPADQPVRLRALRVPVQRPVPGRGRARRDAPAA